MLFILILSKGKWLNSSSGGIARFWKNKIGKNMMKIGSDVKKKFMRLG
jgi:hypothetical protein